VLSSYDLIGVGLRYLNEDSFAEPPNWIII